MLFASVIGIILFSIVVREERQKNASSISYEERKINELRNEYDEVIEDLRAEIRELKKDK